MPRIELCSTFLQYKLYLRNKTELRRRGDFTKDNRRAIFEKITMEGHGVFVNTMADAVPVKPGRTSADSDQSRRAYTLKCHL